MGFTTHTIITQSVTFLSLQLLLISVLNREAPCCRAFSGNGGDKDQLWQCMHSVLMYFRKLMPTQKTMVKNNLMHNDVEE